MALDLSKRRRVIRKVESLNEGQLEELYNWLGLDQEDNLQTARQRNMHLAGVWKTIPDIVFTSVLREIYNNRKAKKL